MRSTLFVVGLWILGPSALGQGPGLPPGAAWRDPSPHQVRSVTVDSSVKLEVLDWGGSGPPLVLLACYLSTHVYDEFAPKLTDQFHVYGITRRGIGASDKPATGYSVQQSGNDLFEAFNSLKLQQALLVGHSCAGQVLTMFAAQHGDRLRGLVYLDGAADPTLDAEVGSPYPDFATLPRPISNDAKRSWDFPEAVNREQLDPLTRLDPMIRKAITVDARMKPDYAQVPVPVLAIYQAQPPFEEMAAGYAIRNDQERAALRQYHAAVRALYTRWQQDLRTGVPTARIVELTGANLFMFLSHEADVLREIRAFAATLTDQ
jgi:pimeloyl-ACP methyl ester carboxylesterase